MATDKPASDRGNGFAGLSDLVSEAQGADVLLPIPDEPLPAMTKRPLGLVGLMIIFGIVNSTREKVDSTTYNQPSTSYKAPQSPALFEILYGSIPPVGSGLLLNFLNTPFGICRKICLDALEVFGLNNLKRYDAMVKFFNYRRSSDRYKVADLSDVNQDMQDKKDLLVQQARLESFKAVALETKG